MPATEADIIRYFRDTYRSRDWNGLCQAFVYNVTRQFGSTPHGTYPSAILAYHDPKTRIVSRDPKKAPAGVFHYWSIGRYGHVAIGLGGSRVIMASSKVSKQIGGNAKNLGIVTVEEYNRRVAGETYLGWAHTNGENDFTFVAPKTSTASTTKPTRIKLPTKFRFTKPSRSVAWRIQQELRDRKRYSGQIDGVFGTRTVKAIQTTIKSVGYDGAVDGIAGAKTCYYIQVYAKKFGSYKGALDAILGPNSWAGFLLGLERP